MEGLVAALIRSAVVVQCAECGRLLDGALLGTDGTVPLEAGTALVRGAAIRERDAPAAATSSGARGEEAAASGRGGGVRGRPMPAAIL